MTAIAWLAAGSAVAGLALAQGNDPRREVHDYLAKHAFGAAEVAALEKGEIVAKASLIGSEVLVVAAAKIPVARDRVLAYYGDMISYVDGSVTLGFGRFSAPPVPGDVKNLAFDRSEADALRSCRPGKCDIKLGGAGIGALQNSVDWKAPDALDRVNAFVRKATLEYVAAYQARGDEALVTYNDRAEPVSLRDQWRGILGNVAHFHEYAPELKTYLEQYPRGKLPGARDVFYWVKEDYGYKPVLSIVHGIVYQPPSRADRAFVVQKQIYANHYFDGSLAIATALSASENGVPVTYLVYANRSRGDMLSGGFGGLRRSAAQTQARKAAQETLGTIKRQLQP